MELQGILYLLLSLHRHVYWTTKLYIGNSVPPPKRVRFDTGNEVVSSDGDRLAPMTLEEFIADDPIPTPAEAEVTRDVLAAKIIENYAFVQKNTQGFMQLISDSKPFLPDSEHQHLEYSCTYLLRKCSEFLSHTDPTRTDYQDNLDALSELYCQLRSNFEECFERARASAQTANDSNTGALILLNNGHLV